MATLTSGTKIPLSSRKKHALDENAKYLEKRHPGWMEQLGAVTPEQAEVMRRADLVGTQSNADGFTDINELSHFDTPDGEARLFSGEKKRYPHFGLSTK